MEIQAKISQIMPLQSGTSANGNPWQKCTIIVEWQDGQYVKKLALSNMKKADAFATLQLYQEYKFKIDVTSREYNGKWYTEATCFAWDPITPQTATPAPAAQQPFAQPVPTPSYGQQPYAAPQAAPQYNAAQPTYNGYGQPSQSQQIPF